MRIIIGSNNRITFPKQFCEENNIKVGDEYELHFICDNIVFEHIDKANSVIKAEEESKLEKQEIKEEPMDISINNIKLSGSKEFVPNLEESQNFYRKVYSKCGLLCRTKPKYIEQYCQRCKGQMLAEEERTKYCPYSQKEESNIEINSDINIDKPQPNLIASEQAELINKSYSNNKSLVTNITKNIESLNKKLDNDIQDNNLYQTDIDFNDKTNIQPIKYTHHHQCYICEEFKDSGFLIDDEHFLCKNCVVRSFINYRKTKRRNK